MSKPKSGMSWGRSFFVIGLPLIVIAVVLGRIIRTASGH